MPLPDFRHGTDTRTEPPGHGPQLLPPSTGSVTAFKVRDPDGHPLELSYNPARVETGNLIAAVAAASGDGRHHYQAQVIGRAPAASARAQ